MSNKLSNKAQKLQAKLSNPLLSSSDSKTSDHAPTKISKKAQKRLNAKIAKALSGDISRFSFLPIKNSRLHKLYKELLSIFWLPSEIPYANERGHYESVGVEYQRLIQRILFFFAPSDGIIVENLGDLLSDLPEEIADKLKEIKQFWSIQIANETVHNQTYSLLIDAIFRSDEEKQKGYEAIKTYQSVRKIAEWMFSFKGNSVPFLERLVAYSVVEYCLFQSAFAVIYYIKKHFPSKFEGLAQANQFIARDEALHGQFGVTAYEEIVDLELEKYGPLSHARIKEIISSALPVIQYFIEDTLPEDVPGLKQKDLVSYVMSTMNNLCEAYSCTKLYPEAINPFQWMISIGLQNKTNFFENKVSEYAKPIHDSEFSLTEAF